VRRLAAEARRLRQLVIDAEPYVPDNEQTRTMDLPARLKGEVEPTLTRRPRDVPARLAKNRPALGTL
jgi:hypothetical protein